MSQFSDKLRTLIQQSGTNVYQMAKNTALDRTTMQRAVTGKRLPSLDFVMTLCEHLCVSATDMALLLDFYEIERIGEKTYTSRKTVKSLFAQFAQWDFMPHQATSASTDATAMIAEDTPFHIIKGQYAVNAYTKAFLENATVEQAEIFVSVPCTYLHFFECLRHICWSISCALQIRHLVPLLKNADDGMKLKENLNALLNVLPLAFSLKNKYKAYFYYCDTSTADDISLQMPYYFFTKHQLVLLSPDFAQAIVCSEAAILKLYQENFEACLHKVRPLTHVLTLGEENALEYANTYDIASQPIYTLEPHPCFSYFYTPEMVQGHIRQDVEHREAFIQQAVAMYSQYHASSIWPTSFFSLHGLAYFVETGRLANLPEQYVIPLSILERKELLQKLRLAIESDVLLYRAIDDAKLTISNIMSLQVYKNNSLLFVAEHHGTVVSCLLTEPQMGAAFCDFLDNMMKSDFILSKEETLCLLDRYCVKIDGMLCKK